MKKKLLSVLLTVSMSAGILAGCGNQDAAATTTPPGHIQNVYTLRPFFR